MEGGSEKKGPSMASKILMLSFGALYDGVIIAVGWASAASTGTVAALPIGVIGFFIAGLIVLFGGFHLFTWSKIHKVKIGTIELAALLIKAIPLVGNSTPIFVSLIGKSAFRAEVVSVLNKVKSIGS